jgi:hypothetical protein
MRCVNIHVPHDSFTRVEGLFNGSYFLRIYPILRNCMDVSFRLNVLSTTNGLEGRGNMDLHTGIILIEGKMNMCLEERHGIGTGHVMGRREMRNEKPSYNHHSSHWLVHIASNASCNYS